MSQARPYERTISERTHKKECVCVCVSEMDAWTVKELRLEEKLLLRF